jgi:hypothetical protein
MKIILYTILAIICTWSDGIFPILFFIFLLSKGIYWMCRGITESYEEEIE